MPEVIIKYKKPETPKILGSLAKYLDFKLEIEMTMFYFQP